MNTFNAKEEWNNRKVKRMSKDQITGEIKFKDTGYINRDLGDALDSVLYKGQHWKDEIDHPCPQKNHEIVSLAIHHICGSHASFYKKNNRWWVYASGYWNCIGS